MTMKLMEKDLYHPTSWPRNRSKWLVLYCLAEADGERQFFESLYVNSSVCYWSLIGGLPHRERWNYISKDVVGLYSITKKGRCFLSKLQEITDACHSWRELTAPLLDGLETWDRAALRRILEPLRYHRPGHPQSHFPFRFAARGGVGWLSAKPGVGWAICRPFTGRAKEFPNEVLASFPKDSWIFFRYGDDAAERLYQQAGLPRVEVTRIIGGTDFWRRNVA